MRPRNPLVTVDLIIEIGEGLVLVERKFPPPGWALVGGFVQYGESLEAAAIREAGEETGLDVTLIEQFHTYSAPGRDPRHHTVTTVYIAKASGNPRGADDAASAAVFSPENLPLPLAFDHGAIIEDYLQYKAGKSLREIFRRKLLHGDSHDKL